MQSRFDRRQMRSAPPKAEMKFNTLTQSFEAVNRHAPALTILFIAIGVVSFAGRRYAQLEFEIASTNEKVKATNENLESLRSETDSMIKESQAASERLAIEYQLKYKHFEESVSLRKPE